MKNKIDESNNPLLYDKLSAGAHFREQYRFVFSATIIATFFIVPTGNVLDVFLKLVLGFAMVFATLYLIYTAASIKYHGSKWIYDIFYVSERVRMKTYDVAVDCFAVGLLLFISLLAVGMGMDILNIELGKVSLWVAIALVMLVLAFTIGMINRGLKNYDIKNNQDTDKLI